MSNNSFFQFLHPTTILISGPTRSGKTSFVVKCIKHHVFHPMPQRIIWFYKEWQENYEQIRQSYPALEFVHGTDFQILNGIQQNEINLVIIDDLMSEAAQSKKISNIFTQESHHRNLSLILIVQNFFNHGKEMRTISLNAHYLVLYKNPRDKTQVRTISYQIFPTNPKFLGNLFEHATSSPYSYLIIDLHPETREEHRILTKIFPPERIKYYVPENV